MTRRPLDIPQERVTVGGAGRIPAYVDAERLCFELSISPDTMERWLRAGRLPPPKTGAPPAKVKRRKVAPERPRRGPKRLWSWQEVQGWIDAGPPSAPVSRDLAQEIEAHARAATQGPPHR